MSLQSAARDNPFEAKKEVEEEWKSQLLTESSKQKSLWASQKADAMVCRFLLLYWKAHRCLERKNMSLFVQNRLMERARRRALGLPKSSQESEPPKRVEELLSSLIQSSSRDQRTEYQEMRKRVFGPDTFWVTEERPSNSFPGAMIFRGSLRGEPGQTVLAVRRALEEAYRGKYVARVFPDVEAMLDAVVSARQTPGPPSYQSQLCIAFEIIPACFAEPRPVSGRQKLVMAGLAMLTVGSSIIYGAGSAVGIVPQVCL